MAQVLSSRGDAAEPAAGARVLIFVDDLDRCEGEVIVRLLEIIKLYLGTRRCVFVLGLDDNAVLAALHKHRSESAEANREYLEKLFQAMIGVPLPNAIGVRRSLVEQLRLHGIPRGPAADSAIQAETDAGRAQLAADIELLLEPNPRKIKNFANGLCAAWAMHGCAGWISSEPEEGRRFVLYHYLRQYHRPVWRLLERQHWALHLLWATLTGAADTDIQRNRLPGDRADQRLLEEIFYRAFSHILPTRQSENEERHGRESLEDAVRQFNDRRDRKRSDENFRILFRQLIGAETELDRRHLYLPLDDAPPGREP